jgi:uncharacterized protein YndB with AHSA1/START domain
LFTKRFGQLICYMATWSDRVYSEPMNSIHQTYVIQATVDQVWQALVDPEIIEAWGGEIHGTNIAVRSPQMLDQYWYSGDWPHPSRVVFELFAEPDGTRLELSHTNYPASEEDDLAAGWHKYYLGPLQALLEKPAESS